jgi:hypothetical protein
LWRCGLRRRRRWRLRSSVGPVGRSEKGSMKNFLISVLWKHFNFYCGRSLMGSPIMSSIH